MKFTPMLCTLALALAGCGSSATSNPSQASNLSTSGFSAAAKVSDGGAWVARWGDSEADGLVLFLSRSGRHLSGDGALFSGLDPLPFKVSGSIGNGGSTDLMLAGFDQQQRPVSRTLCLTWNGSEASGAMLSPTENPRAVVLRPLAAGASLKIPISFSITASASAPVNLQISLNSGAAGEYLGTWQTASGGSPLACVQTYTQGAVTYVPSSFANWGRLAFHDPEGILELGALWFKDGLDIGSGDLDPDSSLLTPSGILHLSN